MDREFIIENIIEIRGISENSYQECPFWDEHGICAEIFPGKKSQILDSDCPCDIYSRGYVKRRMKKLFPELY